jgi:hypothetical protein
MGGMGGGGMQQGPGAGGKKEKKEGPAEAAPKDKQALQPIEPVPAQPRGLRQLQLFELHGYMRMRADYFHRLDLGMGKSNGQSVGSSYADSDATGTKFFPPPAVANETIDGQPVAAAPAGIGNDANCYGALIAQGHQLPVKAGRRCGRHNGFGSANMRLRMEPTLHITDTIKVHATIDALDNLVLGSTPDSFLGDSPFAPIDLYTRTQNPPSAGLNGWSDSIVVKRAYGHIRFGWGLDIKFGRMPHHWGMGLVANDGNGYYRGDKSDIVRQLDMDYGDSVDSLRLGFDFGKDRRNTHTLEALVGLGLDRSDDLAAARPVVELGQPGRPGLQRGEVRQRLPVARCRSSAATTRRCCSASSRSAARSSTTARSPGSAARRSTASPAAPASATASAPTRPGPRATPTTASAATAARSATATSTKSRRQRDPELRQPADPPTRPHRSPRTCGCASTGRPCASSSRPPASSAACSSATSTAAPARPASSTPTIGKGGDLSKRTFLQLGYALEFKYGLFKDRFHLGFDHGFATGDPSGSQGYNPQSPLHHRRRRQPLDQLPLQPGLHAGPPAVPRAARHRRQRRVLQAVDGLLLLRQQLLGPPRHRVRDRPPAGIATFGHKANYGLEIDAALRYHDQQEPIFVQLQYGVMFPFGAFNRNNALRHLPENNGDAKAAQTIQAQIGIKFYRLTRRLARRQATGHPPTR